MAKGLLLDIGGVVLQNAAYLVDTLRSCAAVAAHLSPQETAPRTR